MINLLTLSKGIVLCVVLLMALQMVSAVKVGILVQHEDGDMEGYCVEVDQNADGFVTLSEVDDLEFAEVENQHILCSIDEFVHFNCEEGSEHSIRIFMQNSGEWHSKGIPALDAGATCYDFSFNPADNLDFYSFETNTFTNMKYCAQEGDVIGIIGEPRIGGRPGPPEFDLTPSFEELCAPLRIKDVTASVDGDKKSAIDEPGETIRNVFPGSELELNIELENIGSEELDRKIEDVIVTATLEDIGNDLKEKSDDFTLRADDNKDVTLLFSIPETTDDGDYDLVIELEGEDEENIEFELEWELTVEIDKERHRLHLSNFETTKSQYCAGESGQIVLEIENIGDSEEETLVKISDGSRTLSERIITLKERGTSARYEDSLAFSVPDQAGQQTLTISLTYGDEYLSESTTYSILDCSNAVPQELVHQSDSENVIVVAPEVTEAPTTRTDKLGDTSVFMIGLAIASTLIVFILLILSILKKK